MPPSPDHYLGTDTLGRDVLSRIIFGSRVSLKVGFVAVGLATLIGLLVIRKVLLRFFSDRLDLFAALTGALIVLPQAVAFAAVAGLPAQYGLYAAMVPAIVVRMPSPLRPTALMSPPGNVKIVGFG